MGLFRKSKVIDLTKTQAYPTPKLPMKSSNEDYKDLTKPAQNDFNFFSAISSTSSSTNEKSSSSLDIKSLNVKIEDIEYKLESLTKRINSILDRLDLAEKKIDRNDRRG